MLTTEIGKISCELHLTTCWPLLFSLNKARDSIHNFVYFHWTFHNEKLADVLVSIKKSAQMENMWQSYNISKSLDSFFSHKCTLSHGIRLKSRILYATEWWYSIYEHELMSTIHACRTWIHALVGQLFLYKKLYIWMSHHPLCWSFNLRVFSSWIELIELVALSIRPSIHRVGWPWTIKCCFLCGDWCTWVNIRWESSIQAF